MPDPHATFPYVPQEWKLNIVTVTYQVTADAPLVTQTGPGKLELSSADSKDITFYTADSGGTALAV